MNDHASFHVSQIKPANQACQIWMCSKPVMTGQLKVKPFYDQFKVDRMNGDSDEYQCLYCTFAHTQYFRTILHLVTQHPSYPLLYYQPGLERIQTEHPECIDLTEDEEEENGDYEELFTSDDEDSLVYVCFFCDHSSSSSTAMNNHMWKHLFPNISIKTSHNPFFGQWIDSFIMTQHSQAVVLHNSFQNVIDAQTVRQDCVVCDKINKMLDSGADAIAAPSPLEVAKKKLHFIAHSCLKPIQCLACLQERNTQFWMPWLTRKVVDHLLKYHCKQLKSLPIFKQFALERGTKNLKPNQLDKIKSYFIKHNIVAEFSPQNDKLYRTLPVEEQKALGTLFVAYMDGLKSITRKMSLRQQMATTSKDCDVNLMSDDED